MLMSHQADDKSIDMAAMQSATAQRGIYVNMLLQGRSQDVAWLLPFMYIVHAIYCMCQRFMDLDGSSSDDSILLSQ